MEETWQNQEVDSTELPLVEEVSFQKHPIRYMTYKRLLAIIFWIFPIIGLAIPAFLSPGLWIAYVGSGLTILIAISFIAIPISYRKRSYALRERDLTYKKGWIFSSMITIPFNRIQHTEISRGPIERRYELSTLKIYTAGGSTSDLSIPGLEAEEAEQLKEFVAKKAAIYE
ncbi:MAG: membrane protein YdbS with pleckstrin-like domain [Cryomorphaceae bacterium]|jgi:membrane protein YdbS with pleckstrin-like domain